MISLNNGKKENICKFRDKTCNLILSVIIQAGSFKKGEI